MFPLWPLESLESIMVTRCIFVVGPSTSRYAITPSQFCLVNMRWSTEISSGSSGVPHFSPLSPTHSSRSRPTNDGSNLIKMSGTGVPTKSPAPTLSARREDSISWFRIWSRNPSTPEGVTSPFLSRMNRAAKLDTEMSDAPRRKQLTRDGVVRRWIRSSSTSSSTTRTRIYSAISCGTCGHTDITSTL